MNKITEERIAELKEEVANAEPGGIINCDPEEMNYITELFENVSFHVHLKECTLRVTRRYPVHESFADGLKRLRQATDAGL